MILNLVIKFYAIILGVLLFAAGASIVMAQHEGHDMSKMSKPKPKAKPKPKPKPKPKKQEPVTPQSTTPAPVQSPSPEASPDDSPAAADTTMPETEVRDVLPAPGASPQTATPEATPKATIAEPPTNAPHDMSTMEGPGNNASTDATTESMPGMDMNNTGTATADPNSLMVMSGNNMDIRVGASKNNSIAMGQMGSGTSWQPATTPMFMWYKNVNGWLLFLHGDMKLGINSQGGPRGVTKFESQNWIMPMAFRRVGSGTLQLRGMFSLEPFSLPQGGSGQLFQTGETFKGRPIIDAQHPHDLFMELSATYTMPMGERATWFAYLGYPGEPALGPTAFMHRWSASENPTAPLTHHLQDSTHISFGVFTTGFTYRWFKLEGSVFNGREPGENRYNFEYNPWNSRSARLSFAPNENWAMQISHGFLRNPEALAPGDIRRTTASISYNRRFERGNWATSFIWGRNHGSHGQAGFNLNGYTAESNVNFLEKNYLYTRLELVDKNELLRDEDEHLLGFTHDQHPVFRIGGYTVGYARDVWSSDKFLMAVGSDFTFYSKPKVLDAIYGSNPTSYKVFIRIRPNKMSMGSHSGHAATTPATVADEK